MTHQSGSEAGRYDGAHIGDSVARIVLDPAFTVGTVDRRLFGSFVEHMGRSVYGGVYEPDHPTANAQGFREDVLDLVRELGVTVVRYPGGNFVSSYRWEDGVGPVEERPTRLDLAWRSLETNAFGLNEFAAWAAEADVEPMLATNLGTRGVEAACELLEYCNYPKGTALFDRRIAHGVSQPHDVRLWCLGNEPDGPWQICHQTPPEYGRRAAETARAMRRLDPRVELVACGSSNSAMPTFGEWERVVLEHTYDLVDYLSLHAYYDPAAAPGGEPWDTQSFLASAVDMDRFIAEVIATCDHVRATRRSGRRMMLAFDEWNVWHQSRFPGQDHLDWTESPPLIEDTFSVTDAVVVGSLLGSLLRHADRVRIGCQAQLVNVIAPIRTEPGGRAWRQAIFHPFAQVAAYARGSVLRTEPTGPMVDTGAFGPVPALDAVATYDEDTNRTALFLTHRGSQPLTVHLDLRAAARPVEHLVLCDDDPTAANTADQPDRVRLRPGPTPRRDGGGAFTVALPPVSWTVLRFAPEE